MIYFGMVQMILLEFVHHIVLVVTLMQMAIYAVLNQYVIMFQRNIH